MYVCMQVGSVVGSVIKILDFSRILMNLMKIEFELKSANMRWKSEFEPEFQWKSEFELEFQLKSAVFLQH